VHIRYRNIDMLQCSAVRQGKKNTTRSSTGSDRSHDLCGISFVGLWSKYLGDSFGVFTTHSSAGSDRSRLWHYCYRPRCLLDRPDSRRHLCWGIHTSMIYVYMYLKSTFLSIYMFVCVSLFLSSATMPSGSKGSSTTLFLRYIYISIYTSQEYFEVFIYLSPRNIYQSLYIYLSLPSHSFPVS